jgi:acyl-coenzyme A thioesterase PaaI-like protein
LLQASPNTLNANGVVHGAAIPALVDHAGGYGFQKLICMRGMKLFEPRLESSAWGRLRS